jgi:ubiquinone/menaquinone biosynthesis C-methylase UbiE
MNTNFYKKVGAKGLQELAREYNVNEDISFVKERAAKDEAILDLACGYGRVTLALVKSGYKKVVGVDLAPNLISAARKEAKAKKVAIKFDAGSMTTLPYEKESFDKVFCLWNSFNELLKPQDQHKTLKEVYRVLKPKGKAFFVVIDGESKEMRNAFKTGELNAKKPILTRKFKGHEASQYIYTTKALELLAEKSKFETFSVRSVELHKRRRLLLTLNK